MPFCLSVMSVETHSSLSGTPAGSRMAETRTSHHFCVPAKVLPLATKRPTPPARPAATALIASLRASPSQTSYQRVPRTSLMSPTSNIVWPQALMNRIFASKSRIFMQSVDELSTLRRKPNSWLTSSAESSTAWSFIAVACALSTLT